MNDPITDEKLERIESWEYLPNPIEIRAMARELREHRHAITHVDDDGIRLACTVAIPRIDLRRSHVPTLVIDNALDRLRATLVALVEQDLANSNPGESP